MVHPACSRPSTGARSILLDLRVPGFDGFQLLHQVLAAVPNGTPAHHIERVVELTKPLQTSLELPRNTHSTVVHHPSGADGRTCARLG